MGTSLIIFLFKWRHLSSMPGPLFRLCSPFPLQSPVPLRIFQAQKAAAAKQETFAYFPEWFVLPWSAVGWSGVWSKALVDGMPPAPAPATGLAAVTTLVAPNGSGGAVIASASSPPVRPAGTAALPWSLTHSMSVVAHMVHCPGGASNKQTVRMANYRSGKGDWARRAGRVVSLGRQHKDSLPLWKLRALPPPSLPTTFNRFNWTAAHAAKAGAGGAYFASTAAHPVGLWDRLFGSGSDYHHTTPLLSLLVCASRINGIMDACVFALRSCRPE